jgi:uncharacterized integral membrane protein
MDGVSEVEKGFSVLVVPGCTPVDFGRMNQSGANLETMNFILVLVAIAVNVTSLNLRFFFLMYSFMLAINSKLEWRDQIQERYLKT